MIVVADTSPINYLIQIDADHLLPRLYGRIVIPSAVMQELRDSRAPGIVRQWLSRLPKWAEVRLPSADPDAELLRLDGGEREAIQLSQELEADLLLIDEHSGRKEAKRRGLMTTGTLGVLLSAGELRLIEPESAYRRLLLETSFRTSDRLESHFSEQARQQS